MSDLLATRPTGSLFQHSWESHELAASFAINRRLPFALAYFWASNIPAAYFFKLSALSYHPDPRGIHITSWIRNPYAILLGENAPPSQKTLNTRLRSRMSKITITQNQISLTIHALSLAATPSSDHHIGPRIHTRDVHACTGFA